MDAGVAPWVSPVADPARRPVAYMTSAPTPARICNSESQSVTLCIQAPRPDTHRPMLSVSESESHPLVTVTLMPIRPSDDPTIRLSLLAGRFLILDTRLCHMPPRRATCTTICDPAMFRWQARPFKLMSDADDHICPPRVAQIRTCGDPPSDHPRPGGRRSQCEICMYMDVACEDALRG